MKRKVYILERILYNIPKMEWSEKKMSENKKNGEVIDCNIVSVMKKKDSKLYFIVWQRLANSGFKLVWAKDEAEVIEYFGYNQEYILQTIVKISPRSLPVQYGVQA